MWPKMKAWCSHSLTIAWARLQYLGGVAGAGLVATFSGYDFTSLAAMDSRVAFKVLIAIAITGVVTEFARRRTLAKG
jgi:hypothetical protein